MDRTIADDAATHPRKPLTCRLRAVKPALNSEKPGKIEVPIKRRDQTHTANLGIAMRQKRMFIPMLIILCLSYIGRPLINKKRTPS